MIFLFDDADNQSVFKDLPNWEKAELHAAENSLTVVGEFVSRKDEVTLEEEYIH